MASFGQRSIFVGGIGSMALMTAMLAAMPLYAQTAQTVPAPAAAEEAPAIADIVVTAQRRSERLQNVPVSVQVVGGTEIVSRNLNSLEKLSTMTPSLLVTKGGATNFLTIRGVGSGGSQGFDQSVATFVDDVYHGRSRSTGTTFLDLDRVEVLKGPQSIFFGNNAIAGALNIVTAKPGSSFGGYARALYGTHDQFAAEAAVGGPITDTLGLRVAGTVNGGNGWIHNDSLGKTYPRDRNVAGRATLVFRPSDTFDATLKVEGGHNHRDGDLNLQIVGCPPPAPFAAGAFCRSAIAQGVPTDFGSHNAEGPGQKVVLDTLDSALTLNWHLGNGATLSSVTGFYGYKYRQNLDLDATPVNFVTTSAPENYRQVSQELRLASATGGTLDYIVGAYFQADHLNYHQDGDQPFRTGTVQANPALAALLPYLPLGQAIHYQQEERVYSAFGSLAWNITPKLKLSGGLRASWVTKDYSRQFFYGQATQTFGGIQSLPAALQSLAAGVFGAPVDTSSGSRHDHALMPSARLQYQASRDVMVYASYARGFKAGGFNGSDASGSNVNVPFDPEHVDSYEIGLKSELFDRHLLFNLNLYRSDYSNLQVTVREGYLTGPGYAVVRNAATSRSQGFEAEVRLVPSDRITLGANVTYLDSKYSSFPNASPNSLQQAQGIKVNDLSGTRTPYAPKWSAGISASYAQPIGTGLKLTAELDPFLTSRYILLPGEAPSTQKSYMRLDARVTLATVGNRWALDLIGKNLTNRTILVFASAYPTSLGSYLFAKDETRNIAVQLRYKF